jgi:hypothetical protein
MQRKLALGLGLGSAAVLVGVGVVFFPRLSSAPRANPVPISAPEFAQWKANGLPATGSEVIQPPITDAENAGVEWTKIQTLYRQRELPFMDRSVFWDENNWDNGSVDKILAANDDITQLLIAASKKPRMAPARDWDQGIWAGYENHSMSTQVFWALSYNAFKKARQQDYKGAVEYLETGRRFADLFAQHPLSDGKYAALELRNALVDSASVCAALMADKPQALTALREFLNKIDWKIDWPQTARAYAYIAFSTFRVLSDDQLKVIDADPKKLSGDLPRPNSPLAGEMLRGPLAQSVEVEVMNYWNKFYPRIAAAKEPLEKIFAAMEDERLVYRTSLSSAKQLAALRLIPFDGIGDQAQVFVPRRNLALAYISLLEYRHKTKTLPKTLKEAGIPEFEKSTQQPIAYSLVDGTAQIALSESSFSLRYPMTIFPRTPRKPSPAKN